MADDRHWILPLGLGINFGNIFWVIKFLFHYCDAQAVLVRIYPGHARAPCWHCGGTMSTEPKLRRLLPLLSVHSILPHRVQMFSQRIFDLRRMFLSALPVQQKFDVADE